MHKTKIPLLFLFLFINFNLFCCTLWGVLNKENTEEKVLVAKNRDWNINQKQILKLVKTKRYSYFALIGIENKNEENVKAGINEKGLVVLSATVSSVPKILRKSNGVKNLLGTILENYSSVDEVIKNNELFKKPSFLMIADKNKIALIEIGLRKEICINVIENGIIYHTNHYLSKELKKYNFKISKSSLIRLNRIKELLKQRNKFNINEFINISEDKNNAPYNSIYREGNKSINKTVAVWISQISKTNPLLYIKIRTKNGINTYMFNPYEIFSKDSFIIDP